MAQGDDEARALAAHGTDGADGESAERRRLLEGVSLADYLTPASSGRGIEGRAAEVNAALEVPLAGAGGGVAVPWHVLETRAFTDTAANDGSILQRPILQRLFGAGHGWIRLGVRYRFGGRLVEVGMDSYYRRAWCRLKQRKGRGRGLR